MQYALSAHIHWCRTDDGVVLLDLRTERYLALSQADWQLVAPCIRDWNDWQSDGAMLDQAATRTAGNLIGSLVRSGIIRTGEQVMPRTVTDLPLASRAIPRADVLDVPAFYRSHVVNLGISYVQVRTRLKLQSLTRIVRRVRARKERHCTRTRLADANGVEELARIYLYLRPLLFTARTRCLLDSLVLVEFLAAYRVHPDWVIGVRTQPFGAHSWVQFGALVLNDTPEKVLAFRPILRI